ncbi:MAG: type IV pilus assembly protein PilX [Candidatus Azotimanducaceae bacterium]|jgi:type IV pilus assembly protein PilX
MDATLKNHQQKGVVLVMTLAILLIVTILGVSSVQMTSVMGRIVRNTADSDVAFRAAEAALIAAEEIVEGETALGGYQANANGKYESLTVAEEAAADANGDTGARWERDVVWDGVNSIPVAYTDAEAGSEPRYIVEYVKTVLSDEDRLNLDNVGGGAGADRTIIFRITAAGQGKTEGTQVVLQSSYGKKF